MASAGRGRASLSDAGQPCRLHAHCRVGSYHPRGTALRRRGAPLLGPAPARRPCRWHRPLAPIRAPTAPRVAQDEEVATSSSAADGADFYSLLGVSPTADAGVIKRAYRGLMKQYHPDQSADEESTEFAIFLNEVYETLIDPDRRAAYDAIAGFTPDAVNPFLDTSYERDLVFVDEFTCIGCRNCNNVCAKTFEMEDEYGRARVMRQGVDSDEKLQEAIDTCPVSCIHWVSAPQLALLEDTMAQMERVAAWLMMTSGGGKAGNMSVFVEASMAWEKRQMAIRQRMEKAKWSMWTPATGAWAQASYDEQAQRAAGAESEAEGGSSGEAGSGRSGLGKRASAASVAAASRRWRDFQRRKRNREQMFLEASTSGSTDSA